MTLTMITEGLLKLLEANHYNPATIRFYQREWNKISAFLYAEYSDEEFEMERGLAYLEKQYGFVTRYNDGTLSQQRVQLLRVVQYAGGLQIAPGSYASLSCIKESSCS